MKKRFFVLFIVLITFFITGCNKDALKFKEDYESLNGKTNANNKEYRVITISEDNPFVYSDLETLNKKIEKNGTFIVYFGANWCPWCRSVLPYAIEEAKKYDISTIYYIDVRPGNDISKDIRDIYDVNENGEVYLSHEGLDSYHKFLVYADPVLNEYSSHGVTLNNTKYQGQKRVGAPNFIIFKNGVAERLETGVSAKETDSYMELNDEIINDTRKKFDIFFESFKD